MASTCNAPVHIKRSYAERLPPILAKRHGKKKHYTRSEIMDSITHAGLPVDYSCWAMAMLEAPESFESFHRASGEVCSYVAMRSEMLQLIPTPASDAWSLFDWDWISWDVLDWLDWSP